MTSATDRLEFRIPISPTPSFFAQVRFFNFALRRLGPTYRRAKLTIVVGDRCDINAVRSLNRWSEDDNIAWERVPDAVTDEFSTWGTANWRLHLPAGDADVIILSDADTVLLRDIDPVLAGLPSGQPAIRGHMAHSAPWVSNPDSPDGTDPAFWPWLFGRLGIAWPKETYPYSSDSAQTEPRVPAYFNLGFVAMNAAALTILDAGIDAMERQLNVLTRSHMRCQIALTALAHQARFDIGLLPAIYNAANDPVHFATNRVSVDEIRVLHFLRTDEIDRSTILLPENVDTFLAQRLTHPANVALQTLVREYRQTLPLPQLRSPPWRSGGLLDWIRPRRWLGKVGRRQTPDVAFPAQPRRWE